MSDIPVDSRDSKENKDVSDPNQTKGPSENAKELIQRGTPIDDEVRLKLYEMRNEKKGSGELGKMVKGLPHDQEEQVRDNAIAQSDKTSIIDKKGGEILDYPDKPVDSNDGK